MADDSVTSWIGLMKSGDDDAARRIWERYFAAICNYARAKLGPDARRAQDEEDLALSAMFALCKGATEDRFRKLEDRDDLWQLLTMIVARKVSNTRRHLRVRGETGESDLGSSPADGAILEQILVGEPTIEDLRGIDVHGDELLAMHDDKLRQVALLKLSGYTNREIGTIQQRSTSTIERYMHMIREIWKSA